MANGRQINPMGLWKLYSLNISDTGNYLPRFTPQLQGYKVTGLVYTVATVDQRLFTPGCSD